MKVAIIGSRDLEFYDFDSVLPEGTDCIISGGAKGIDQCAAAYARKHGLELIEYLPDYRLYGRGAPIRRNRKIVDAADYVVAVWNGKSRGTLDVIAYAESRKPVRVVNMKMVES